MIEIIEPLRQVETGEYNGIGSRYVALGREVSLPDGVTQPERDKGLGIINRYLGGATLAVAKDIRVSVASPIENGKILDKRIASWFLIGRDAQQSEVVDTTGLAGKRFVTTAEEILTRAIRTTRNVAEMKILQGGKKSATDWRSIFEGLVKADIFGKDFQPTIITSLGGYDGDVPLAAPFNVLPGLELATKLRDNGYDPMMIVTSAAKYGVDCNGLDLYKASGNWRTTLSAYECLAQRFYPEMVNNLSFETLVPSGVEAYPEQLVRAAKQCCDEDESLRATAEQYGAGAEAFVRYMLSHTQAFRDYQLTPEAAFVLKVGAPSEGRFSRWQKQVIERAAPLQDGFVPNMMVDAQKASPKYGHVSLYYPRLGNRPPYYPESTIPEQPEPTVYESAQPADYQAFLETIALDNPSLKRYDDLGIALQKTRVSPSEYLSMFSYQKSRAFLPLWEKAGVNL